jgi:hypothetical protein
MSGWTRKWATFLKATGSFTNSYIDVDIDDDNQLLLCCVVSYSSFWNRDAHWEGFLEAYIARAAFAHSRTNCLIEGSHINTFPTSNDASTTAAAAMEAVLAGDSKRGLESCESRATRLKFGPPAGMFIFYWLFFLLSDDLQIELWRWRWTATTTITAHHH